jgi:hypothetical protein
MMKSCAAAIARRPLDLRLGRARVPEGDVGRDRVGKEEALLEDRADVAAQVVQVQAADVDPVDQQPASETS